MVALYAPLVLHWCRQWGLREDDAADVFQDVFRAVASHRAGFRRDLSGGTFRGWLRTITRNKVNDAMRRRRREPIGVGGSEAQVQLTQFPDPALPEAESGDAAVSVLLRRGLELIRDEFEARTWHAFWLTAVERRAPKDGAAEPGMSGGAVRGAKSRRNPGCPGARCGARSRECCTGCVPNSATGPRSAPHNLFTHANILAVTSVTIEPPKTAPGAYVPIFALTSLAPGRKRVPRTRECLRSWRAAGLQVRSFNHPDEIPELAALYDVEFVPIAETTIGTFGRHYVPIHAMLDWAAERDVPALLINADIFLRMEAWELHRVRRLSAGGLCYFVRHNFAGTLATASAESDGIDGFLVQGRDVANYPRSIMSLGQPVWDYWLPHVFAARELPLFSVEFPAAFHENHPRAWSDDAWHRCGLEFLRVTGVPCADRSFPGVCGMAWHLRRQFDRKRVAIPQHPIAIRDWVQNTFGGPDPKLFLELGAHHGRDTEWLSRVPNVTLHAFEPDPRNRPPARPNVVLHRAAVADRDGTGSLLLSEPGWGQEWTESSSLKRPKNHLTRYPVTFGATVEVGLVTLDTFRRRHNLGDIDFIWADVQGTEGEMIRGGRETLARTRYLYTEYSDDEMYEGQATLDDILRLLPDFRVLDLWPTDVLLENRNMV